MTLLIVFVSIFILILIIDSGHNYSVSGFSIESSLYNRRHSVYSSKIKRRITTASNNKYGKALFNNSNNNAVTLLSSLSSSTITTITNKKSSNLKVLVVGGNGRVGGSSARHVHILSSLLLTDDDGEEGTHNVDLILGGRSRRSFESSKSRILSQLLDEAKSSSSSSSSSSPSISLYSSSVLPSISFQPLDIENDSIESLSNVIQNCGANAVIHTAGPFQQRTLPTLLQACIDAGVPYVDACDEPPLCASSKELNKLAIENNVVGITAAGIWPGVSSLMCAKAIDELCRLDKEDDRNKMIGNDEDNEKRENSDTKIDIEMSFFTAGTGNAGATIVSATFLLLCQAALTIVNFKKFDKEPWTEPLQVDFKGQQKIKTVRLLDNPDVFTLYESKTYKSYIRSLSSRFATSPNIWNQLFGAMKQWVPRSILSDVKLMQNLSIFSLPIIRAVDKIVGATNAMRVDATCVKSGRKCTFVVTHDDLEQCVGLAMAAFVLELLEDGKRDRKSNTNIKPGIYYPAELPLESRERILEQVKKYAIVWDFEVIPPVKK